MANSFGTSRRKVERAKAHIAELEKETTLFFANRPYSVVIDPDPNSPIHEVHKLRFTKSLPDSFFDLTVDAVQNLRSALDNACYGLAIAAEKVKPRFAAFPFAGSKDDFDNAIKGRSKDVPEYIYPIFHGYQPYRGGNDFLWALSEVSNTDKHKLLTIGLGSLLGDVVGEGALVQMPINPTWDKLKHEIELATCLAGSAVKYRANFSLFVAFDEIPIVGGEPILKVLHYFVEIVEDILSHIEDGI
jgi:hypothetical protein